MAEQIQTKLQEIKQAGRLGLMTHVVVGYPDIESTRALIDTMVAAGVDMIELQIPFSDPMADGSTIMHASEEALQNGVTVEECMEFMGDVSKQYDVPFICMSYYNIVFNYGAEAFAKKLGELGVAGFIIPDAIPGTKEGDALYASAAEAAIVPVTVLAPNNSPERLGELKEALNVLAYLPLHKGVTGARADMHSAMEDEVEKIKGVTDAAIVAGFGISTPEHIALVKASGADLAVIGSALLDTFNKEGLSSVKTFLEKMKAATL